MRSEIRVRQPDSPRRSRDLAALVAGRIEAPAGRWLGGLVLCRGQHDAGMPELVPNGLQISTCQMGQRGGAGTQVV